MPAEFEDYNLSAITREQMHKATDLRGSLLSADIGSVLRAFICTKKQTTLVKQIGLDLFDYLTEEVRLLGILTADQLVEFCARRILSQIELDQATQLLRSAAKRYPPIDVIRLIDVVVYAVSKIQGFLCLDLVELCELITSYLCSVEDKIKNWAFLKDSLPVLHAVDPTCFLVLC